MQESTLIKEHESLKTPKFSYGRSEETLSSAISWLKYAVIFLFAQNYAYFHHLGSIPI